jgi:hypothetical protein
VVSLIYCFFNAEVTTLLKRSLVKLKCLLMNKDLNLEMSRLDTNGEERNEKKSIQSDHNVRNNNRRLSSQRCQTTLTINGPKTHDKSSFLHDKNNEIVAASSDVEYAND